MTKRIVLAALLGGLAMFAWEFVAHMVLPLGDAGIKGLPNEQAVMTAVKESVKEPGFYFFPWPEDRPGMTSEEKRQAMAKAEERWQIGPSGMLIAHPNGAPIMMSRQLAAQFGVDFLAMLVAAMLLAQASALDYGGRVVFVAMLGLLPSLTVEIPHWNWYGFPAIWTLAQFVTHLVGFIAGGLALAKIVRPAASA